MGFIFTLIFVVNAYLTPPVLFGPLSVIHPEVLVAVLALASSGPAMMKSSILRSPQSIALIGLGGAVLISIARSGWLGGAVAALYYYLPLPFIFFMASLHFNTKKRLKIVFLAMLLVSIYYTVRGMLDLHHEVIPSLFLYGDGALRRLRGLGFVFDPNDFAQLMVALIPGMFLFRGKGGFANTFLVGAPVLALVTGLYLTHSRGAAVALMLVIAVAVRRRLGAVPAGLIAGCIFAASLALGWSGGRDVSMEAGADRMDAWATGLEMIKAHPIAGVGIGQFGDYNNGLTAHNTIVVCAAEMGLVGFFFWILFVFTNLRNCIKIGQVLDSAKTARAPKVEKSSVRNRYLMQATDPPAAQTIALADTATAPEWMPYRHPNAFQKKEVFDEADLRRTARLLAYSLIGFLAAGWFLSRAMSLWLFLLAGMSDGIVRAAIEKGIPFERDRLPDLLRYSAIVAASVLFLLYVFLKARGI